ncbi:hypothetical protein [Cellulomonas triticagri]|uniref:Uncharacterized protein n=1 Tax=Cellulomonas triticagri TaxID=2483352 RepID=A0A3M2JQF3_9CELL|nr:hypothetical protein [Cellulomonas triticagri]RMI13873.1 hypothetical protein EBM89_02565 [Cellulomonas triticagri]
MTASVGFAWQTLWSLRFVRVVASSAVVVSAAGAALLTLALAAVPGADLSQDGLLLVLLRTNVAIPVVSAVLAVAVVGGDVRRGTVLAGVLRARGRGRAWMARLLVAVVSSAGVALACTVVCVAVVTAVAGPLAPGVVLPAALGTVALAVGWACVGAGSGSAIRNPLAAVAVPVVVAYAVEPIIRTSAAFGPEVLRVLAARLPFSSGTDLVRGDATTSGAVLDSAAAWQPGAVVFGAFVLAVAAAGHVVFRRADLVPTDLA